MSYPCPILSMSYLASFFFPLLNYAICIKLFLSR
uniref:Uncharacterized protein n=1 Tax=Rhizophora mucronata TaxID=61149 RepID=A0A2P2P6U7_RHIMU